MLSLDRQVGRHHDLWPAPLSGCGYVNPAGSDPLGSTAAAASAALSGVLQQALGHGQPPQQADLNGVQDAPLGGIGGGGADQAATTRAAAGQPPWQQPWPPDVVCPRRAAGPPLDGLACSPIAPVMAVGASVDGHAGLSPFSPDRFRNPLRLASQDQVPINAMHVDYAGAALPTVGWAMRNLSPRRALGSTPRRPGAAEPGGHASRAACRTVRPRRQGADVFTGGRAWPRRCSAAVGLRRRRRSRGGRGVDAAVARRRGHSRRR
ncbi:unnamed protein product [Prorocentrum cordatum]|uniref:Subtilisin n=1 Tax=Prorocentrum cordatum TaxID=2364126 RepID=A0ABN9SP41_9DINO|nr:unnamed protein product [Polarella glacialis]